MLDMPIRAGRKLQDAAVFLREGMSPLGWAGAALVLLAAAVSEMMPEKK